MHLDLRPRSCWSIERDGVVLTCASRTEQQPDVFIKPRRVMPSCCCCSPSLNGATTEMGWVQPSGFKGCIYARQRQGLTGEKQAMAGILIEFRLGAQVLGRNKCRHAVPHLLTHLLQYLVSFSILSSAPSSISHQLSLPKRAITPDVTRGECRWRKSCRHAQHATYPKLQSPYPCNLTRNRGLDQLFLAFWHKASLSLSVSVYWTVSSFLRSAETPTTCTCTTSWPLLLVNVHCPRPCPRPRTSLSLSLPPPLSLPLSVTVFVSCQPPPFSTKFSVPCLTPC